MNRHVESKKERGVNSTGRIAVVAGVFFIVAAVAAIAGG